MKIFERLLTKAKQIRVGAFSTRPNAIEQYQSVETFALCVSEE